MTASFGTSLMVGVDAVGFSRSSFSTVAATSGDGHASESSKAGGGIELLFLVDRREGALTTFMLATQIKDTVPSDLITPLSLLPDFEEVFVGGFGTTRSI